MNGQAIFVVGVLIALCLSGDFRAWRCEASNFSLARDDTTDKVTAAGRKYDFTEDNSTELYSHANSTLPVTDNNATTSSPKPVTLDDFIMITRTEFILLTKRTKISIRGRLQNRYLMVADGNGTQYLVPLVRQTGVENEIKEKLKNNSGNELICIDDICYTYEQAQIRLANLEALRQGTIQPSHVPNFAIMTTVVLIVGISGITGNLLIIIGVFKSKKLRNSTTVLLCCMAVSDILVLGVCLPLQVTQQFVLTAQMTIHACRLWHYVRHFAIVSSTLTMSVMAVDRYIAVCYPLKARIYSTVKNARVWVAATWIASMAITAPVIWMVKSIPFYGGYYCYRSYWSYNIRAAYNTVMLFLVLVIPLGVMLPTYARMFCVLYRSTGVARELQNAKSQENTEKLPSKPDSESIKSRIQVIRMLVMIVLVFSFCWGPPVLIETFDSVRLYFFDIRTATVSADVKFALHTIAVCNSFFNPLIYFAMSRQFRQYVVSMCRTIRKPQGASSSGQAKTTSESLSRTPAPSGADKNTV